MMVYTDMSYFEMHYFWMIVLRGMVSLFVLQIWVRKTSDSTKMRIYLGQLQRGAFVIRRRSAA